MVVAGAMGGAGRAYDRSRTRDLQRAAMFSKPAPGPKSAFFDKNIRSKASGVHRNTKRHWHLHWYMITRGKPLLQLTDVAEVFSDAVEAVQHRGSVLPDEGGEECSPPRSPRRNSVFSSTPVDASVEHKGLRARIWDISENNSLVNTGVFLAIIVSTVTDIVETETKVAGPPDSPANIAMNNIDIELLKCMSQ